MCRDPRLCVCVLSCTSSISTCPSKYKQSSIWHNPHMSWSSRTKTASTLGIYEATSEFFLPSTRLKLSIRKFVDKFSKAFFLYLNVFSVMSCLGISRIKCTPILRIRFLLDVMRKGFQQFRQTRFDSQRSCSNPTFPPIVPWSCESCVSPCSRSSL